MERMGPRRAGHENGDGTGAGWTGAVRAAAVTAAAVAALAGCSVTVQPKNAAAASSLSSTSPSPSAVSSSTAPSASAPSTSAKPTVTPSDVDHTVCTNVREVLANLESRLRTDKDSDSRSAVDYRTAGTALRTQDARTDNFELKTALKTIGIDYQTVGHEAAYHESTTADLRKAAEDSKPLQTLCGGGESSSSPASASSSR